MVRVEAAIKDRVHHALRPLDEDDKATAEALIKAIAAGASGGYTTEETQAIEALYADWREARSDTP